METNPRHPFFWIVVSLAAVLSSIFLLAASVIYQYGALDKRLGWEYGFQDGKCLITAVDPQGDPAKKLRKGDQILLINGSPPVAESQAMHLAVLTFRGEVYDMRIARGSQEINLTLHAPVQKSKANLVRVLVPYSASLIMFLIAIVIGAARPEERFAQLFTITWCSVALIFLAVAIDPIRDLFPRSEANLHTLIWMLSFSPICGATAYHFCCRFPPGVRETRFWTFLKNVFYLWGGLVAVLYAGLRLAILQWPDRLLYVLHNNQSFAWLLEQSSNGLMFTSLLAISALIIRNHFQISEINQRRRLRWVAVGSVVGVFPSLLFFVTKFAFSSFELKSSIASQCLDSMLLASDVFIVLVPLSTAYAIFRHRLYDIHVVVRQGVRYLLAKNALRILIYLPAVIILHAVLKKRDQNLAQLLLHNTTYLGILIAAVTGLKFRNQCLDWLDRKFFREAYDSRKILVSLIDEIKNINSIPEISRWVTQQLELALHPRQVFVFHRRKERGDLVLGYSSGSHSHDLSIPSESGLLRAFRKSAAARKFPSNEMEELSEPERTWLQQLGIHLIVPMNDSDQRLVGVLLLGEKKSEEPYTASDCKMLEALAGQISILCENLLLKEHVDSEIKIKRDVLTHLKEQKRNVLKECPTCGKCYDAEVLSCEQDHSELILTLPVDRVVDEKYRLNRLLGRGGMGAVYQATDLRLNREVAIKILVGRMFGDRLALRRFEREARASAQLNHPNIVGVHDFGGIQGEGAYLVMELIQGFTLRSYLNQYGNVSPDLAADWFDQILEGMKIAHQNGIVHRDLKPENILISRKDVDGWVVKILDFGLAKIRFPDPAESRSLTAPGTIIGTLAYMSPEQISGGEIDDHTDIFSIGVMVIEALTGKTPFSGATGSDIIMAIISKSFELEGDAPEVRALNSILQKSIAKNPKNRYPSLSALQKDLIGAIRQVPPFPSAEIKPVEVGSRIQTHIAIP